MLLLLALLPLWSHCGLFAALRLLLRLLLPCTLSIRLPLPLLLGALLRLLPPLRLLLPLRLLRLLLLLLFTRLLPACQHAPELRHVAIHQLLNLCQSRGSGVSSEHVYIPGHSPDRPPLPQTRRIAKSPATHLLVKVHVSVVGQHLEHQPPAPPALHR